MKSMKKMCSTERIVKEIDAAGDSWWMGPVFSIILFVILTGMDAATLYSIFALVFSDSPLLTFLLTGGISLSLNFIPLLLARELHLLRYHLNGVHAAHLWVLVVTFFLLFATTFALRWTTRDLVFAEDESLVSSTTAADTTTEENSSASDSPQAIVGSVLLGISPLITSVINFAVGYLSDDPMRTRYRALRQLDARLNYQYAEAEAARQELSDRAAHIDAISQYDQEQLAASKEYSKAVTDLIKGLARFLQARKLGDPESISYLSDD